jgi:hypothetical protein
MDGPWCYKLREPPTLEVKTSQIWKYLPDSHFPYFFYLCAHHYKLIDMEILVFGITALLNQPFLSQQFGVFKM